MGRPREKNTLPITNISFSYRPQQLYPGLNGNYLGTQIIQEIDRIADRERCSRSHIIVCGLAEYLERHQLGNSQTLLSSYESDGVKSQGQLEQGIVNDFLCRHRDGWVIYAKDVYKAARVQLGKPPGEVIPTGDRLIERLIELEVPITR